MPKSKQKSILAKKLLARKLLELSYLISGTTPAATMRTSTSTSTSTAYPRLPDLSYLIGTIIVSATASATAMRTFIASNTAQSKFLISRHKILNRVSKDKLKNTTIKISFKLAKNKRKISNYLAILIQKTQKIISLNKDIHLSSLSYTLTGTTGGTKIIATRTFTASATAQSRILNRVSNMNSKEKETFENLTKISKIIIKSWKFQQRHQISVKLITKINPFIFFRPI